ncbi:MAG: VOC family protein [Planctomycetota bacterium]
MVNNPPAGMPACCPYLFYDDLESAMRFLAAAFGFEKRFAHAGADGKIAHAQLAHGAAVIMLGATNAPGALRRGRSPKDAGSLNASVYMYVDDVDAHCRRAHQAGAEVLTEPANTFWGDRLYCAVDPEGQFWCFATHTRDVAL